MKTSDYRIPVSQTESVHVITITPRQVNGPLPTILSIHGTGGASYGARRWRLRLGRHLAQHGFAIILFDCRGHGYSDGEKVNTTVSSMLQDTNSVLNWLDTQPFVDLNRLGIFGFSLGSALAILTTSQESNRIKSLLLYTIPCDMEKGYLWYFERFAPRSLDKIFTSTEPVWQDILEDYVSQEFFRDLSNHDILKAIGQLNVPILVLQPDDDDQVPLWVTKRAFLAIPHSTKKNLITIPGSHTMISDKGWNTSQEETVTKYVTDWFQKTL